MKNKLLLFACTLLIYFADPAFSANAPVLLIVIIFSSLSSYLNWNYLRLFPVGGFILCCLASPDWSIFLPLICYDLLLTRRQYFCLPALIPFILWGEGAGLLPFFSDLMILVAAFALKRNVLRDQRLFKELHQLRDASEEMKRHLERQNRDLLIRQDNETALATLAERNRIARDIHDSVGHLLSSALLQIGALLAIHKDATLQKELTAIRNTLAEAMNSIRESVHGLYDQSINLEQQLNELTEKFQFCPLQLDYSVQHDPGRKLKETLLAVTREALTNIIRHSRATEARITLREHPAFYQLVIADNGRAASIDPGDGIGLKNIRDRAAAFNGYFNIERKHGFQLFLSFPKEERS